MIKKRANRVQGSMHLVIHSLVFPKIDDYFMGKRIDVLFLLMVLLMKKGMKINKDGVKARL